MESGIIAFKVRVTAKVQNVSECFDAKPGMVMQHHKPKCHWFTLFNVKVKVKAYIIKI